MTISRRSVSFLYPFWQERVLLLSSQDQPKPFSFTVKLLFSCIPPVGRSISFIKRVTFSDLHLFISHLLVQPTNHQTYQYMCYSDSDKIWHSLLLYPFQHSHLFLQSFYLYPSYSVKDEGIPLASLREKKKKSKTNAVLTLDSTLYRCTVFK